MKSAFQEFNRIDGQIQRSYHEAAVKMGLPDMELHRQPPDWGRNHHLLRRSRGADAEGGFRPLLQRGVCTDRGGAGGGHPEEIHGKGGADQRLFRRRPAHRQRLL